MNVRDILAAVAMHSWATKFDSDQTDQLAELSYEIADAMLKVGYPPKDEDRKVMYGIGVEDSCGQYAMTIGPVKSQDLLLECIATNDGVIIRFNSDGTDEVLWRWKNSQWVPA